MKLAGVLLLPVLVLFAQEPPNPPAPPNPAPPQPMRARAPQRPPQPGQPPRPGEPGQPPQAQAPDFRALREYLNLSDGQIRRIQEAGEKARTDVAEKERTLRPQIQQKRRALEDLLDAANPDAAAVGRAMIEIRGLERQIRQAQEGVRSAGLNVLTPEQRAKFKAIEDAANLPEATRQAQRLGLVPAPPRPPMAPRVQPQPQLPVQPPPPVR